MRFFLTSSNYSAKKVKILAKYGTQITCFAQIRAYFLYLIA